MLIGDEDALVTLAQNAPHSLVEALRDSIQSSVDLPLLQTGAATELTD